MIASQDPKLYFPGSRGTCEQSAAQEPYMGTRSSALTFPARRKLSVTYKPKEQDERAWHRFNCNGISHVARNHLDHKQHVDSKGERDSNLTLVLRMKVIRVEEYGVCCLIKAGVDCSEKCFWPRRIYIYSIGRKKNIPDVLAAVSANETDDCG